MARVEPTISGLLGAEQTPPSEAALGEPARPLAGHCTPQVRLATPAILRLCMAKIFREGEPGA